MANCISYAQVVISGSIFKLMYYHWSKMSRVAKGRFSPVLSSE